MIDFSCIRMRKKESLLSTEVHTLSDKRVTANFQTPKG